MTNTSLIADIHCHVLYFEVRFIVGILQFGQQESLLNVIYEFFF